MAIPRLCSISGCGKKCHAKGLCSAHYQMLRKHGDPKLRMRPANGETRSYVKEVLTTHVGDDCLTWPFSIGSHGYPQFNSEEGQQLVNRFLCEEKFGPPPTGEHHAAHNCGNKMCVNRHHLRWATPQENIDDKETHGTLLKGEKTPSAKLSADDVRSIRALIGTKSHREIGRMFNVSNGTVMRIKNGECWGSVR